MTSGNVGRLCVLGGAQNAAGSRSGSQTVFSRNNASAAPSSGEPELLEVHAGRVACAPLQPGAVWAESRLPRYLLKGRRRLHETGSGPGYFCSLRRVAAEERRHDQMTFPYTYGEVSHF